MGAVLALAMQWVLFWLQLCSGCCFGFSYVMGAVLASKDAVWASVMQWVLFGLQLCNGCCFGSSYVMDSVWASDM